jgi:hypothetical protein
MFLEETRLDQVARTRVEDVVESAHLDRVDLAAA